MSMGLSAAGGDVLSAAIIYGQREEGWDMDDAGWQQPRQTRRQDKYRTTDESSGTNVWQNERMELRQTRRQDGNRTTDKSY